MLHNNNFKGIHRLAKKVYLENKIRNIILIVSILLTTILITVSMKSIFTIRSIEEIINSTSTDSGNIDEILSTIENSTPLERVNGIGNLVEVKENVFISLEGEKNIYLKPLTLEGLKEKYKDKTIIGRLPEKSNEIILPTWFITGKIDYTIEWKNIFMNTSVIQNDANQTLTSNKHSFTVVGYYEEEQPKHYSFIELYVPINVESESINSILIVFMFFTLLSGFLLISNIFYIHVVNETRFYGMLKTIGLNKRGMKIIIYYGAVINLLFAIPFGLILGSLLSRKIIPTFLALTSLKGSHIISNDIRIYILTCLFIIATVFVCCRKPIEYVMNISAVEAAKFIGSEKNITNSTMKVIKEKNVLSRIAMYNIFSNERKTFLTISSICLSGITVILSLGYYATFNSSNYIGNRINEDFKITQLNKMIPTLDLSEINGNIISELEEIPYVDKISCEYEMISKNTSSNFWSYGAMVRSGEVFKYKDLTDYERVLLGVNEDVYRKIMVKIKEEPKGLSEYDKILYENGEGIVLCNAPEDIKGKDITLDFLVNDRLVSKSFKVIDVVNSDVKTIDGVAGLYISESGFDNIFKGEKYLTSISIDIKSKSDLKVSHYYIENVLKRNNAEESLLFNSKYSLMEEVNGKRQGILIIGVVLSLFIGTIGFISIINSMLSNMITRNVEFALLESIGMTKKQQRSMLIFEGLNYTLYTSVFLIPSSFLINIFVLGQSNSNAVFNPLIYFISLIFTIGLITTIMILIPLVCFKHLKSKTIVERIRESEVV